LPFSALKVYYFGGIEIEVDSKLFKFQW